MNLSPLEQADVGFCPSVRLSVKRVLCDKTKASSEKSSIMTNRKSRTMFLMSLIWKAYIAPKLPKGAQEEQNQA